MLKFRLENVIFSSFDSDAKNFQFSTRMQKNFNFRLGHQKFQFSTRKLVLKIFGAKIKIFKLSVQKIYLMNFFLAF